MGDKVTLSPLTVEDNSSYENGLNQRLDTLADEFDNVVYRDGSTDLSGPINANSKRIYNLGEPLSLNDAVRLQDMENILSNADLTLQFQSAEHIATAGQTAFNFVASALTGYVSVFVNGTKLATSDYSVNGATVTLTTPAAASDVVSLQGFTVAAVVPTTTSITYTPSSTGGVSRTLQAVFDETVSVTAYMGVLTVTAAFQAALNTGKHVHVPGGTYALTSPVVSTANGQRISGDGAATIITQSGTNSNANVIQIVHDDCIVEGLNITPGTTVTSLAQGWAIQVTGDRCIVRNNRVSGARRGGVHLSSSNNNIVESNIFVDSVVTQDPLDPEPQSAMGYDIYLDGTSSYNIIRSNQCVSGCGVGIGCQTSVIAGVQYGNLIDSNLCKDHPCYGIMLYGSFETPDNTPVHDCVITNNIVEDISGIVYIDGASWFYGAGIYIASASKFVCTGNRVKSTNTDTSLPHTSGTPAAISSTGYGDGIIANNVIEDCYDGIWLTQGNTSTVSDVCLIQNNVMTNVRRHGVHLSNAIAAKVTGNRIVGSGLVNRGILLNDTLVIGDRFDLSYNYISGFNNGIEILTTNAFVRASGNIIRNCVNLGIYSTAPRIHVSDNDISMNAGQTAAILYTAGALSGVCRDNTMVADTSGLVAQSTAVLKDGNILNGVPLLPPEYADDAAAAAGNVAIGHYYKTGSVIKRRIA